MLRTHAAHLASALLFAAVNLLLVKHYADGGSATEVFLFTNAQMLGGLLLVFVFYGLQFEVTESKEYDCGVPLWAAAISVVLLPPVGLFILIVTRGAVQRFGRIATLRPMVVAAGAANIAAVCLLPGVSLFMLAPLVSLLLLFLAGDTRIKCPEPACIRPDTLGRAVIRTSMDLALLVPPLLLNVFAFRVLTQIDYIDVQKVIYCLTIMALLAPQVERQLFQDADTGANRPQPKLLFSLALGTSYAGIAFGAWFLGVPPHAMWYLGAAPLISLLFTVRLAQVRRNDFLYCACVAALFLVEALLVLTLLTWLHLAGKLGLGAVLGAMLLLSFLQLMTLHIPPRRLLFASRSNK